MKKHLFALLAMGLVGSALAQTPPPVAGPNIVTNLSGVATEIDASGTVLRNLRVGDTIGPGSTVSTTGTMTISGGGCSANLGTGQSMVMSATSVCDLNLAQQQAPGGGGTGTGVAGGGTGGGGFFSSGGLFTPLNMALLGGGLATLRVVTQAADTPTPISNN